VRERGVPGHGRLLGAPMGTCSYYGVAKRYI
jgi:hypothetical protein